MPTTSPGWNCSTFPAAIRWLLSPLFFRLARLACNRDPITQTNSMLAAATRTCQNRTIIFRRPETTLLLLPVCGCDIFIIYQKGVSYQTSAISAPRSQIPITVSVPAPKRIQLTTPSNASPPEHFLIRSNARKRRIKITQLPTVGTNPRHHQESCEFPCRINSVSSMTTSVNVG